MEFERGNGILLPIFSLPSEYGIGSLGKEAYDFVDFLVKAGIKYRQILPLGPTSYGDSPYQSFSSFAGNPYFIDLDLLAEEGLLKKSDYKNVDFGGTVTDKGQYIDYEKMYQTRFEVLYKAYKNFKIGTDYLTFFEDEAYRLEDYCLYMAIKKVTGEKPWQDFPIDLRDRNPVVLWAFKNNNSDLIEFFSFIQYEFLRQWENLKKYANERGVEIIGDLPIYVAADSSDSRAHRNILKLDQATKKAFFVGGCPPDAYSDDGQLWGNPVYDWERLEETGYDFRLKRIEKSLTLYDCLRLDHFRGFESYYEIPAEQKTAREGRRVKAKSDFFFERVKETFPEGKFIGEDLGIITDEVRLMKEKTGFPGMKVIQFAFNGKFDSEYLPHNYEKNSVTYSSTHDQDTLKGRLDSLSPEKLKEVEAYFGLKEGDDYCLEIIRSLMMSVADLSIFELQDFLELGNEARINVPGFVGNNWKWRLNKKMVTDELAERIRNMGKLYGRI